MYQTKEASAQPVTSPLLTKCAPTLQAKLPAVSRALQLLQAAVPRYPVVFADGTDTVVAHAPEDPAHAALLLQAAESSHQVLFSSECHSWPRCYKRARPAPAPAPAPALAHSL